MSDVYPKLEIVDIGAVMVRFGDSVELGTNQQVHQFAQTLINAAPATLRQSLLELVPSYNALLIYYDFIQTSETELMTALKPFLSAQSSTSAAATETDGTQHRVGVLYTAEHGPDLERIAAHAQCSVEAVIQLHNSVIYHVYAIGFSPNFAYMGDVPEALRVPRLDTPRQRVPAGTLAIAEQQTAIYPRSSPGGWNLMGYCPEIPDLKAGDRVQFYALSERTLAHSGQGG